MMTKSAYLLAILAAAVSTAAVAKDLKQGKTSMPPTLKASQMTDAEMDRVTAGLSFINYGPTGGYNLIVNPGQGNLPGCNCASGLGQVYGTPAIETAAYSHAAKLAP
jgi:hypothetical protein